MWIKLYLSVIIPTDEAACVFVRVIFLPWIEGAGGAGTRAREGAYRIHQEKGQTSAECRGVLRGQAEAPGNF